MHYYTSPINDFVFSFHYEIGKISQGKIYFSQVKCPKYISVEIVPSRSAVPGGSGGSFQELFNPLAAATAAKLLQSCPTLCDPIDSSPPAPPSLGFSRQEHWSRLPFPSPMHESEKWKWSHSVVSDPQWPRGLQPSRLLHPWDFPGESTGVGCHCLLRTLV